MSREISIQRNIFQKLKFLFLGKERPNFLTRVSVGIGFVIWLYLFSWHILALLTITLLDSLKHPEKIKAAFNTIGPKYGFKDVMNSLITHSIIEIAIYIFILVGLILIWRKKKIGFLFYIIGNTATVLVTILMNWTYFSLEFPIIDLMLIICSTLYFGIGALIFYKWKSKKEKNSLITDQ